MTDVSQRLKRIYAALGEMITSDPDHFGVRSFPVSGGLTIDFSDGLSAEQLENRAMQAVSLVAHLPDFLRKWAKENSLDPKEVEQTVSDSEALKILIDLTNADKHGGEPRDAGRSGLRPRIRRVNRAMRIRGDSPASMTFTLQGSRAELSEATGNLSAVIGGEVADATGARIGDLEDLLAAGLSALESLFLRYQSKLNCRRL